MMQKFILGAYWNARRESLDDCAEKVSRFFERLAKVDPLLGHWFERGRSRRDALERRIDTVDIEGLRDLLLKGRNRRDIGRDVIDELGFKLSLWNGADEDETEASINIYCGSYSEHVGNSIVLDLPYQSEDLEWVARADALLALAAETWQPEWAGIMSKKAMRERDFDADHPFVDWMIYVPRPIESVPQPGHVEALKDLGSIIVVQPNPPVGDDPEELSRIRIAESLLALR
jgi:hypothetical protein